MDILRRLGAWLDRPGFPWKSLIVTFSIGEYFLESYLSYRQYKVLQGTKVPKQLEHEVDQKTFDKSQVCAILQILRDLANTTLRTTAAQKPSTDSFPASSVNSSLSPSSATTSIPSFGLSLVFSSPGTCPRVSKAR